MSRSGYTEDYDICDQSDQWRQIMWRGRVASSIRGKRGQAFLKELVAALDAMPVKELVANDLRRPDGSVCAMGSVGAKRGVSLEALDVEDYNGIANVFNIAAPLVQEIEWENDSGSYGNETPAERWSRIRRWAERHIRADIA